MLGEEEFHRSLGVAWYRRLATEASEEARACLVAATEAQLPAVLSWLGAEDPAAALLVEAGVTSPGAERLDTFRASVGELLALAGVDVSSVAPAEEWDEARGRGPGQPDQDSIERARGDRNRMLFVE
jgi:1,2-phenylacetyl-CoA epoxidase catalytic subunit